MDPQDPELDALEDAFKGIELDINVDAALESAVDDVNGQDSNVLDYFVEDDIDFVGDEVDWDHLLVDIDSDVEQRTLFPTISGGANRTEDLESTNPLTALPIGPVERLFDTQSMADFYGQGSSSPQRAEQTPTPTPNQRNRRQSHNDGGATTPRPTEQGSKPSDWKIIRHVRSREPDWMLSSNVTAVRRTIKEKTGIVAKPWQVSVMLDIVNAQKDVVVLAGTGSGKSLPYQLIPLIKTNAIVLVVLPTIALMCD